MRISECLLLTVNKRVRFGKQFVFDAQSSHVNLLKFFHEPSHVIEISKSRVGIEQDWNGSGIAHVFSCLKRLRPAYLIAVADSF